MRDLASLSVREILALAIFLEEERRRMYGDFAEALRDSSPAYAELLNELSCGGSARRQRLIEFFSRRFGPHIPLVRRNDVRGLTRLKGLWLARPLTPELVRNHVNAVGVEAGDFYVRAAELAGDAEIRDFLNTFLGDDTLPGHGKIRDDDASRSLQKSEDTSWMRRLADRIRCSE